MDINLLLQKCDDIIVNELKSELKEQGHHNTGNLESKIEGKITTNGNDGTLIGTAPYYALILHHGYGPEKATWKSFPALVEYFESKGKSEDEAKGFAAATIQSWKSGGMPTPGSYAYSQNGRRLNVVDVVNKATTALVNRTMSEGLDDIINLKFNETKSETI